MHSARLSDFSMVFFRWIPPCIYICAQKKPPVQALWFEPFLAADDGRIHGRMDRSCRQHLGSPTVANSRGAAGVCGFAFHFYLQYCSYVPGREVAWRCWFWWRNQWSGYVMGYPTSFLTHLGFPNKVGWTIDRLVGGDLKETHGFQSWIRSMVSSAWWIYRKLRLSFLGLN